MCQKIRKGALLGLVFHVRDFLKPSKLSTKYFLLNVHNAQKVVHT